ncbi:NACHT domain-containing protein [Streptomyces sp. NPDC051907]|uniref:NACHT domain-containing protein n=1 Tax=Streptomyces sp. NPDC051907 TaxID=3155284 RepID=UPI00344A854A
MDDPLDRGLMEEDATRTALAEVLTNARLMAGLTQRDLAARVGVSSSSVSAYEQGHRIPSNGAVRALATVLPLDSHELLRLRHAAKSQSPGPQKPSADEAFETAYLASLVAANDRIGIFGADVRLRNGWPFSPLYTVLPAVGRDEGGVRVRADQILDADRRVLIRGHAGSGKTTLLQWLSVTAPDQGRVPFLLRVRHLAHFVREQPGVSQLVGISAPGLAHPQPAGWTGRVLAAGRGLLLVDGIDEVAPAEREYVRRWLADLLAAYPANVCVATSRPSAVAESWLANLGFTEFALAPMTMDDVRSHIVKWHEAVASEHKDGAVIDSHLDGLLAAVATNPGLRDLVTNPLMCALVCAVNYDRRGVLPHRRKELYDTALSMLLNRRDTERRIVSPEGITLAEGPQIQVLQAIALWLQRNGQTAIDADRAVRLIERMLPSLPQSAAGAQAVDVYRHLLSRSGLLREPAPGRVEFVHRVFQAYLAAKEAVETDAFAELLVRAHEDQWQDVVLLAFGHARRAERVMLFRGLMNRMEKEPEHRTRLCLLAAAGLAESLELAPDVRLEVAERVAEIIPPPTADVALALAEAGPMVLELLPNPEELDPADPRTRLTRRTAELIGGEAAEMYLKRFPSPSPQRDGPGRLPDRPVASPLLVESWTTEGAVRTPASRVLNLVGGEDPSQIAPLAGSVRHVVCRGDIPDLSVLRLLPLVHTLMIADNPSLTHLRDLAALRRLRTLTVSGCPALGDLTALAGSGVMFLELSPSPRAAVLSALASVRRLRMLYLPLVEQEFDPSELGRRLPRVTVLTGVGIPA